MLIVVDDKPQDSASASSATIDLTRGLTLCEVSRFLCL